MKRLPDYAAAAWLLLVIGAVVTVAIIGVWRVPIAGSVSANLLITKIIYPLTIAVAAILVLGTYVAMRELFGKTTTDGAVTRLVSLVRDAGAARELRQQLEDDDR